MFFLDSDRAAKAEANSRNENGATSSDISSDEAAGRATITRPLIGKKKVKMLVAKAANKGRKVELPVTPIANANAAPLVLVKQERNASLA